MTPFLVGLCMCVFLCQNLGNTPHWPQVYPGFGGLIQLLLFSLDRKLFEMGHSFEQIRLVLFIYFSYCYIKTKINTVLVHPILSGS